MHCPFCSHSETRVIDSRLTAGGSQIRRRRECASCNARFSTLESAELALPRVIKRDESREPFDVQKLRSGVLKALEKRSVATDVIDATIAGLVQQIRLAGEREISSREVGEKVMAALYEIDQVGYVRFASVYRSFKDVSAFRHEVERLEKRKKRRRSSRAKSSPQLPLLDSSDSGQE